MLRSDSSLNRELSVLEKLLIPNPNPSKWYIKYCCCFYKNI